MSRLLRLVFAILVVVALPAHALIPKATGGFLVAGQFGWTMIDACTAAANASKAQYPSAGAFTSAPKVTLTNGTNYCQWQFFASSSVGYVNGSVNVTNAPAACPLNSVASGTACACNAGYIEDSTHTSCVAKPSELEQFCKDHAAVKNPFPQSGTISSTSGMPVASCYKPQPPFPGVDAAKGCAMKLGDGIMVPHDGNALLRDWSATGIPTGSTCEDAAATDTAPKAAPDPCPNGFAGTVNGRTVCVDREPDKGIEGVKGTEVKNSDGTSTITKETTKCEGGQCTTTTETTTKDATGATVGAPKVEETKEGIGSKCAKDPGNKVCSAVGLGNGDGGSSFTGNCTSGFQAKGDDPVLNAMALEQHTRNCKMFGDPDAQLQTIPKQSKTATLGTVPAGGWGTSCPSPMTFSFYGQTFEVSFQPLCNSAPTVRAFVLLICGLLSMFIVYSALRGSH